ncbi:PREDICTED: vacuolar protein sorting-associated protein 41 homolog [Amphimedon queenslandica]|uniref:Vps41 beta-propeller domain-containing protein n=1 Tax=Amphimedon queenslandica TaxID=400682 RepID=A0A1X7VUG2_AMPQE|nr:PREDICTED: vacuolar protein sorting-associated protein 41 homolog [Amphimedon queenslandica]|eukprot:XP_003382724.1 PREDICTED: vacuolar protein sorting-associated protein 41 homolog [Amphimedon queenslandica]
MEADEVSSYEEEEGSTSGEEAEDGEEEEEDDDEDEEPLLKYSRFAKDVVNSLSQMPSNTTEGEPKNVIVCMAVHPKFIALGTYDGTVKLLDHTGTVLADREYRLHIAQINHISVDQEGDFMACCSNDGKVSIVGLFTAKYNNSVQFERAVKSVAIHPHFGKSTNRMFAIGIDKVLLVEERRWPLIGYKNTEIHSGYGIVEVIKWRDNYMAWANEKTVFAYNVATKSLITCIRFDEESPISLPCSLCWVKNGLLLVGRGHIVKVAEVREVTENVVLMDGYASGVEAQPAKKKELMKISAQNMFPNFLVCGVVPIMNRDKSWNMVVLGYDAHINQEEAIHKGTVPPPHLIVRPPAMYLPDSEEFETVEEIACDTLMPRGYTYCRCTEYHLECVMTGDEDRFYVLTPIDIILAQKLDANDHVEWLIKRNRFEEAMKYAENPSNARLLNTGKLQEVGIAYIYHLLEHKKFEDAARKCSGVLGLNVQRWEDIIWQFIAKGVLHKILPYIPKSKPKLSPTIYEMVLNQFLIHDPEELYKIIQDWPPNLYDSNVIMNAVSDRLAKQPNDINILKVKAKLFEDRGDSESALDIYLRLGDVEVFDLIANKNLHNSLLDNLEYLLQLGEEPLTKTVELLVEFRHDDVIPPQKVVSKLEGFRTEKRWEYFLHRYLDLLFDRDPKAGSEYHERQVQLYADYNRKKLLPFLRACNDIPLKKALDVCTNRSLYEAMVFLLDRMGNPKEALRLIVSKLHDVDQAILFVREKDDEELWDTLIQLSRDLPDFITGLLQNAGTHIDPTKLIKEIPSQLKIANLGLSLVKLLNDYQLQVNLREGCKKILVKDSHDLMEKLHILHNRATSFDMGATCFNCSREFSVDDATTLMMFFCGHMYHQNCVSHKNDMDICHLCYRSSNKNLRQPLHP